MSNKNPTPPPIHSRWQSGQSGNPNGRKKGVPNTATRLKKLLEIVQHADNPVTGEKEEMTVAEQMDYAIISKALKGDVKAYNELLNRLEGKPKETLDQKVTVNPAREILRASGLLED
jgi:hypothetical protein